MDKDLRNVALMVIAVVGLALGGWIVASHFEAQSYNKLTGHNISTWEAMWIQLRVQDAPRLKK